MTKAPKIILPLTVVLVTTSLAIYSPLTDYSVADVGRNFTDARSYRHCHNTPRRTYCHTKEQLPITIRPGQILQDVNRYV
jgi:hypothetical protein